jgi:3-oxoacyl-[acyl-carrier protein] reductase
MEYTKKAGEGIVVVLGATGAVGSVLVRRLAGEGKAVLAAGRREAALSDLADPLGVPWIVADATDASQIDACFRRAAELGPVVGAAHCVGSLLLKPGHLTTDAEWFHTIATNLTSAFFVVRAAARAMMKEGGSVVLVSSAAAQVGLANHEAIASAKAGIAGLVRSAASTYAPRGIRFNGVAPGLVRSNMSAGLFANEISVEASRKLHALGRLGEPEDVAQAIRWLLLPEESGWVTGQVICVDGGLAAVRPRS